MSRRCMPYKSPSSLSLWSCRQESIPKAYRSHMHCVKVSSLLVLRALWSFLCSSSLYEHISADEEFWGGIKLLNQHSPPFGWSSTMWEKRCQPATTWRWPLLLAVPMHNSYKVHALSCMQDKSCSFGGVAHLAIMQATPHNDFWRPLRKFSLRLLLIEMATAITIWMLQDLDHRSLKRLSEIW